MCLYAAHKFTLCGCIWDEWSHVCKDLGWCPGRQLVILANYKRLCDECSDEESIRRRREKVLHLLEAVEMVGSQDLSDEDPSKEYPHTESLISRLCYPVEAGRPRKKRVAGASTGRK